MYVRALLLALAGHLGSRLEPEPAPAEQRGAWIRRVVLAAVAVITGVAGCVVLWVAGLMALWDTPWLLTYVAVSGAVLLLVSAAASFGAMALAGRAVARRNAARAARGTDADAFPRSVAMRLLVAVLPAMNMLRGNRAIMGRQRGAGGWHGKGPDRG